jgi:hypothetical protein
MSAPRLPATYGGIIGQPLQCALDGDALHGIEVMVQLPLDFVHGPLDGDRAGIWWPAAPAGAVAAHVAGLKPKSRRRRPQKPHGGRCCAGRCGGTGGCIQPLGGTGIDSGGIARRGYCIGWRGGAGIGACPSVGRWRQIVGVEPKLLDLLAWRAERRVRMAVVIANIIDGQIIDTPALT